MPSLIRIPTTLAREEYEIKVRCYLGCGTVFIFGKRLVTATIKQLIAYTGWYIEKAKSDSRASGINCFLGNFSDRIMEGNYNLGKQGRFNFSGGKTGPTGKRECQELFLEQQFVNEWFRVDKKDRVENACVSRK